MKVEIYRTSEYERAQNLTFDPNMGRDFISNSEVLFCTCGCFSSSSSSSDFAKLCDDERCCCRCKAENAVPFDNDSAKLERTALPKRAESDVRPV